MTPGCRFARRSLWPVLLLPSVAQAQLPSNSLPAYVANERVLVGRYRDEEGGDDMRVAVDLNADHTAAYLITTGEKGEPFIRADGLWTLQDDVIHIHNRPGPVFLESAGAPTRDPAVQLSITVTNPDGSAAEGLGVTWEDASGLFVVGDGRYSVARDEAFAASRVFVIRRADRRVLRTLELTAMGANSFALTYYPSDQEPFDIPAIALDARAQAIEVEVGTATIRLGRIAG